MHVKTPATRSDFSTIMASRPRAKAIMNTTRISIPGGFWLCFRRGRISRWYQMPARLYFRILAILWFRPAGTPVDSRPGPWSVGDRRCPDRFRPANRQLFFRRVPAAKARDEAQAAAGDRGGAGDHGLLRSSASVTGHARRYGGGLGRTAGLCRPWLTKIHEEWVRGTLPEILAEFSSRTSLRGEITLVVDRGAVVAQKAEASWPPSIAQHLHDEMQKTGAPRNEALKIVARQRGISRRDAYQLLLHDPQKLIIDGTGSPTKS